MKLWGGNYEGDSDRAFWEFGRSLPCDRRLIAEEIAASRAYVKALERCGTLPAADAARLDGALATLFARVAADPALLETDDEDVHSFVEARLSEELGELASQMHVGRSRNEQAVTALRLWSRGAIDRLRAATAGLVEALCDQGAAAADALMPGFTHTRAAEPITFGHFAGAHAWAFVRARQRLGDARRRVDVLPLGSGALAGTALPLDREALARDLGFEAVSENALDAVGDRDFAAELVFGCALLQTQASRLSDDLIRFSGPEYGFFALPEAYTTGSSLMPQKKNPDALELVRGKAARVDGDVVRLLALLKGLPTGYQKDLQEDKEAVFDAADTAEGSLGILAGVVRGLRLDREAMRRGCTDEMLAASLAVALAREGAPFRTAHARVGALVAKAQREDVSLRAAAAAELSPAVLDSLDFETAVRAKAARGGTAPDAVRASLAAARAAVTAG